MLSNIDLSKNALSSKSPKKNFATKNFAKQLVCRLKAVRIHSTLRSEERNTRTVYVEIIFIFRVKIINLILN